MSYQRHAALAALSIAASAAAVMSFPGSASAQEYPSHPITMVVPFPPGGVADLTGRPTAMALEKVLKQRVIVENRPGAGGATGNAHVINARPDGYTILMALSSLSVIPEAEKLAGKKPTYELSQLAPIARISADPNVLAVRTDAPWKTVRDLVEFAKKNPGKVSYSSSGIYGALHMPMEIFAHAAGIKLWHVPFNGGGPAITALLGSQVETTAGGPSALKGHFDGGRLRPLAIWGSQRLASLPDVPTFKELGLDAEYFIWSGVLVSAATPPEIRNRLRDAARTAVRDPDFIAQMAKIETPVAYLDAPDFQRYWDADAKKLAETVKRIGLVEQK